MVGMEDQGENFAQIRRDIDELKSAEITLDNYKKWSSKITNKDTIIISQIENNKRDFVGEQEDLRMQTKGDRFNETLNDNYVDRKIYDIQQRMIRILTDTFSWKVIQTEMYNILFEKLLTLIDDTNAFAIKRDALKEMREMEEKRNDVILESVSQMINFTKEIVGNKFNLMDDKLFASQRMISEQARVERNEMFNAFSKLTEAIASRTKTEIEIVQKTKPLEENLKEKEILKKDSAEDIYTNTSKSNPKTQKKEVRKEDFDMKNDDIESSFSSLGVDK